MVVTKMQSSYFIMKHFVRIWAENELLRDERGIYEVTFYGVLKLAQTSPLERNGGKNTGNNSVFSENHTITQHKKNVPF